MCWQKSKAPKRLKRCCYFEEHFGETCLFALLLRSTWEHTTHVCTYIQHMYVQYGLETTFFVNWCHINKISLDTLHVVCLKCTQPEISTCYTWGVAVCNEQYLPGASISCMTRQQEWSPSPHRSLCTKAYFPKLSKFFWKPLLVEEPGPTLQQSQLFSCTHVAHLPGCPMVRVGLGTLAL